MVKTDCQLQDELQRKEQEHEDTLMEVKRNLESWMDELQLMLEDVESERAENEKKLQLIQRLLFITNPSSVETVRDEER